MYVGKVKLTVFPQAYIMMKQVFCVQDVMTDETADSDAQAHQELHCLSMWKKWN